MVRKKTTEENTRQIYASIREDIYLAAKSRAAQMRMSLREFIEHSLDSALNGQQSSPNAAHPVPAVWDDEYLRMQAEQPLGSPVELTAEEREKIVRAMFGVGSHHSMNGRTGIE